MSTARPARSDVTSTTTAWCFGRASSERPRSTEKVSWESRVALMTREVRRSPTPAAREDLEERAASAASWARTREAMASLWTRHARTCASARPESACTAAATRWPSRLASSSHAWALSRSVTPESASAAGSSMRKWSFLSRRNAHTSSVVHRRAAGTRPSVAFSICGGRGRRGRGHAGCGSVRERYST